MLLNPRRYGDGAKDLWTTLNTIQENIIRGGRRNPYRRRPDGSRMPKSRAVKGIDEDMKLNKALWQMAEILRTQGSNGLVTLAGATEQPWPNPKIPRLSFRASQSRIIRNNLLQSALAFDASRWQCSMHW
jgi:hypothetical protein